jgi:hypothetical protein
MTSTTAFELRLDALQMLDGEDPQLSANMCSVSCSSTCLVTCAATTT